MRLLEHLILQFRFKLGLQAQAHQGFKFVYSDHSEDKWIKGYRTYLQQDQPEQ